MFLTPDELYELTRKRRSDAQARVLRHMGVEFRTRADGTVAVLEAHVVHLMGGAAGKIAETRPEPNWGAL